MSSPNVNATDNAIVDIGKRSLDAGGYFAGSPIGC